MTWVTLEQATAEMEQLQRELAELRELAEAVEKLDRDMMRPLHNLFGVKNDDMVALGICATMYGGLVADAYQPTLADAIIALAKKLEAHNATD